VNEEKLTSVLEDLGLQKLRSSNGNIMALCPFHSDRSRSWGISTEDRNHVWQCFAGCGSGTLAMLVARIKNIDVVEAIRWLERYDADVADLGSENDWFIPTFEESRTKKGEFSIPETALAVFSSSIHKSILKRGFSISFLRKFEVCTDSKLKRVVFPVRNTNGKLVGFVGRTWVKNATLRYYFYASFPKGQYLLGSHLPIDRKKPIHLVEGPVDYLRGHQAKLPNVLCSMGCTVTNAQLRLLLQTGCSDLVCLYDQDRAGQLAKRKLYEKLDGRMQLYDAPIPEGQDIGGMSSSAVQKVAKRAELYGLFV